MSDFASLHCRGSCLLGREAAGQARSSVVRMSVHKGAWHSASIITNMSKSAGRTVLQAKTCVHQEDVVLVGTTVFRAAWACQYELCEG